MKILIIDNYDSFTYNLYQYIGDILKDTTPNFSLEVKRNDEITLKQIYSSGYDKVIISPGPGTPADPKYFGVCAQVLKEVGKKIPVLGVCLGMQGLAHVYGGKVKKANLPMHGKPSQIIHDRENLFARLPQKIEVMRYHSLIVDPLKIPDCLQVTAIVEDNLKKEQELKQIKIDKNTEIMGLNHVEYPIYGVQFHPESFATEAGKEILINFLKI
jgi:anthranilate synthase component 2